MKDRDLKGEEEETNGQIDKEGVKGDERRENKRRLRGGSVGGRENWAVCQGLFHLWSPGLSELPPSLTSVMSSMKGPLGGMEDLTQGSDCDRHQLTLPSQAGFC